MESKRLSKETDDIIDYLHMNSTNWLSKIDEIDLEYKNSKPPILVDAHSDASKSKHGNAF